MFSGRGAAWLARLLGVQEVPGSNPGGPTSLIKELHRPNPHTLTRWSPTGVQNGRQFRTPNGFSAASGVLEVVTHNPHNTQNPSGGPALPPILPWLLRILTILKIQCPAVSHTDW